MGRRGFQFTLSTLMKAVMVSAACAGIVAPIVFAFYERVADMSSEITVVLFVAALAMLPVAFAWLLFESSASRCPHCGTRLGRAEGRCPKCETVIAK